MNSSIPEPTSHEVRAQLLSRRERLREYVSEERATPQLVQLLKEVDAAMERVDGGTYGVCEVCNQSIEQDYLLAEPLVRICLSHLTGEQQRAIERDLQLASVIQGKLLPVCNTRIDGWEMCYHYEPLGPVSGDYCDLVKPKTDLEDMYFFLGDVSGKGVAASLLASHLHAMFRTLLSSGLSLKPLVERANRLFFESASSSNFATLVAGRASKTGEVEICNAGHCYPLMVQNGQIRSVESMGLPVGVFFNAEYQVRKFHLSPGDTLLLYTDGLTETTDPAGNEYSEARLSALVAGQHHRSPEELIRVVLDDLRQFRGSSPKTDDLTIMALRRAM